MWLCGWWEGAVLGVKPCGHCCPLRSSCALPKERNECPACPPVLMSTSRTNVCAFKASVCSLLGGIDELAYISTNECRFDGQEKSVVCTVSSDSTVRAWDVQEVSRVEGPGCDSQVLREVLPLH